MQLVATEIQANYRAVEPFRLPFHSGSMLRGVLGRALRAAGCAKIDAVCAGECERARARTYARLFDPLVPEPLPHRFLKGQTKAPQPMIPVFPTPGQGSPSFSLRILGRLPRGELATLLEALERVSEFELVLDQALHPDRAVIPALFSRARCAFQVKPDERLPYLGQERKKILGRVQVRDLYGHG